MATATLFPAEAGVTGASVTLRPAILVKRFLNHLAALRMARAESELRRLGYSVARLSAEDAQLFKL